MFSALIAMLLSTAPLHAEEVGRYFRAWQGFEKPGLASGDLLKLLPPFMQTTVDLYEGRGLNNYLVAIPPADHPSFVPDEFALVMLSSFAEYDAVRSTPEGKAYGDSHWDLFDKYTSRSAPLASDIPDTLVHNTVYDVLREPVDWKSGHTKFFLGYRKGNVAPAEFLKRLSFHVKLVAPGLNRHGLDGYIVIANENYEAAYLHWTSEAAANAGYASSEGQVVSRDAQGFLDRQMFETAEPFQGKVEPGKFYSTL